MDSMKPKVAVATVSGKAYYMMIKELNRLKIPCLSFKPWDSIPMEIDVVITTERERVSVDHPSVVALKEGEDPSEAVGRAVRMAMEKAGEDSVIFGVDPGKTYGLAILAGRKVYYSSSYSTLGRTLRAILERLKSFPFSRRIVRVGKGAQPYTGDLVRSLNELLPQDVELEIVNEEGTSKSSSFLKGLKGGKDASSAAMIAMRAGKPYPRTEEGKLPA